MLNYYKNSWKSQTNLFDRIRGHYMNQKDKNGSFSECPSLQFNEDCNSIKERFGLLLTSYSPFTKENIDEEDWDTFERIMNVGISTFGVENTNTILTSVFWDSQIDTIWKNLPHLNDELSKKN